MYQYIYKKYSSLSSDHLSRIAINFIIHQRNNLGDIPQITLNNVDLNDLNQKPAIQNIVQRLEALMAQPKSCFNIKDFHWLLSYGSSAMIELFKKNIDQAELITEWRAKLFLGLSKELTKERFLHVDCITPELQMISTEKKDRCLVCFTGVNFKMMMPNQLFNHIALEYFDAVLFVNDTYKSRFTKGVLGIGDSIDQVIHQLNKITKDYATVSLAGVSTGGIIASQMAHTSHINRCLLLSPTFHFKEDNAVTEKSTLDPKKMRIYFSGDNGLDSELKSKWGEFFSSESLKTLQSESHNSAVELLRQNKFKDVMKWLSS